MAGDWLDALPPESDALEGTAPEDEIDSVAYEAAIRANRGGVQLDQGENVVFDQQEYDRVLAQERRGQKPPGLSQPLEKDARCLNCSHYDSQTGPTGDIDEDHGLCSLYTYPVEAQLWCRSWDAAD